MIWVILGLAWFGSIMWYLLLVRLTNRRERLLEQFRQQDARRDGRGLRILPKEE